ncbi:MAG TPA: hypothetical protein PLB05_00165 [Candidatus Omnitrophota bacterium]|nr:hypothetical protein [Candidatus Omnitrophota bacterium]
MTTKKKNNIIFFTAYVLSGAVLLGIVYGNLKSSSPAGTPQSVGVPPGNTKVNEQESLETSGLKRHRALYWKTVE